MSPDAGGSPQKPHYRAFLLRAWAEDHEQGLQWRFQLESPHGKIVEKFGDLERMVDYLTDELGIEHSVND